MITMQKNTSFGGKISDIVTPEFSCVLTTAKESVLKGLSTIVWLPEYGKTPIVNILYGGSTNKGKRQSIHSDISERMNRMGENGMCFAQAFEFAVQPHLNSGEVSEIESSDIFLNLCEDAREATAPFYNDTTLEEPASNNKGLLSGGLPSRLFKYALFLLAAYLFILIVGK